MPYNYWYDRSFMKQEVDRCRKLEELLDLVLWLQEVNECYQWAIRLWKNDAYPIPTDQIDCLEDLIDNAQQAIYDWRP
jgi:hypothetical protein